MSAVIVPDMPEADYYAHPALSASGAKTIALRSPAHYRWEQTYRVEKKAYDVGHAVHAKVLGVGMPVIEIPADLLAANGAATTTAARLFIEQSRAEGLVPLKAAELGPINAMAEAVLAHPEARRLLAQPGAPEVSMFATDPETGVDLRARVDYLPAVGGTLVDLKTAVSADPRTWGRTVATHGYHIQDAFYCHVLGLASGDERAEFAFIAVEKTAPYLVAVTRLTDCYRDLGRRQMRAAIDTYAACLAADTWPGYGDDTHPIEPPAWLAYADDEIEI